MAMQWDNIQRILWSTDTIRKQHAPALKMLSHRAHELQFFTIGCGLRRATIVSSPDTSYITNKVREYGLKWKMMGEYKAYEGFSHRLQKADPGDPTISYFAIAREEKDLDLMYQGFSTFDNDLQGELLGYPKCCIEAFKIRWTTLHHNDHAIDAAIETFGKVSSDITLSDIGYTNQFFRYVGPQLVFHLPCSFMCPASLELAHKHEEKELELFGENKIYEFLSRPFTASIYRGIIEVTSDVFRLVSATDFTKEKITIKVS